MDDSATRVFHAHFATDDYEILREACILKLEAKNASINRKDVAMSRLHEDLRSCFQNDAIHHVVWYRVAVHAGLMPGSIDHFFSLSLFEQHSFINQLQEQCNRDGLVLWAYMQEARTGEHACKFTALFDLDPWYDQAR